MKMVKNWTAHCILLIILIKKYSSSETIDCVAELKKQNSSSLIYADCGSSASDIINIIYCGGSEFLVMYPMDMDFIDKCVYKYERSSNDPIVIQHELKNVNGKGCLPQVSYEDVVSMKIWVQKNPPVTIDDDVYGIDCFYNDTSLTSTFQLRLLTVKDLYGLTLRDEREQEELGEVQLGDNTLQTMQDQSVRRIDLQRIQAAVKDLYKVKGKLLVKSNGQVISTVYKNTPLRLELSFISFLGDISVSVRKCLAKDSHKIASDISIIENGCGIARHTGDTFLIEQKHPEYLITPQFILNPEVINSDQIYVECDVEVCKGKNNCTNSCDPAKQNSSVFELKLLLESQPLQYLLVDGEQKGTVYIQRHEWRLELPYYIVIGVLFVILVILIIMIAVLTIKVLQQQPGNRSGARNADDVSEETPTGKSSIKGITPRSGADSGVHVSFSRNLPDVEEQDDGNLPPFPAFDDFESPPEVPAPRRNEADAGPDPYARGRSASLADFDSDVQSALGALRASSRIDDPDAGDREGYRDASTITFIGNRRPDQQSQKITRL